MSGPENRAIYPSLKGRSVVVTGGATGIGASIVEGFVRQGARVFFLDFNEDAGQALVKRLATGAAAPGFIACDLTDTDRIADAFRRIDEESGGVDVLVNNAANDDRHEMEKVTSAYWDERIAVNLKHLFFCTQAVAPGMKRKGAGVIVNMGSVSWHVGMANMVVYQTAKAGIEGMTRALARDLGAHGVRVSCVVPGGVRTQRQMDLWDTPEGEAEMLGRQFIPTRIEPHDVAAMVMFLASDDARLCVGHTYFVDAGWC